MEYKFNGTPGPWRWELNEKNKQVNLCGGKPFFDLSVMTFSRYGMNGAAPCFNDKIEPDWQVMVRVEKLGEIQKGREHHSDWFKNINHPDANLIASAPDLLLAAIELIEVLEQENLLNFDNSDLAKDSYKNIKSAVHKALNITE